MYTFIFITDFTNKGNNCVQNFFKTNNKINGQTQSAIEHSAF